MAPPNLDARGDGLVTVGLVDVGLDPIPTVSDLAEELKCGVLLVEILDVEGCVGAEICDVVLDGPDDAVDLLEELCGGDDVLLLLVWY